MMHARVRVLSPAFPWITQRFVWALVTLALLVAAATFFHAALVLAVYLGIVIAGLVMADIAIGPRRHALDVQREPVEHLALRSPAQLRYSLTNRSRVNLRYEIVDTPLEALDLPETPVIGVVGPGRRKVAALPAMPRLRGPARLGTLYVAVHNPIGFIARRWRLAGETEIRIYPDLSAVERYGELARRGRLVEAGFRKLRRRGRGGEFDSLREWTPDDEFRSISWKASARRAKLMVAQYDIERSQTVVLALDAGRLMTPRLGDQRKFDYAITAALSVAYIAALADDKVGLIAFASDILEHIAPRSGAAHTAGMTQRVYDLQPRFEEADYGRAFTYLRRRQPKRSLVIFFTDMFDPVASAATLSNLALLTPRHLAVCVLMNDEAVQRALATEPATPLQAYEASVAATLQMERQKAAAILAQRGIIVIDTPAKDLTVSLINAYVEIKTRSLL
ncbi:MAG: DUF58 domain-containing protein [Candidatus Eremiobacteraeota bacterium]|nr:DUF58 domain-containing protein [Candidatus Eremiobacteraeota bacterium]